MVDNFELLKYQINTFPGCFYHLQIIKRNKDHASMRGNNRTIKQYYVEDADYLLKHREEIISLCEMLYFCMNSDNFIVVRFLLFNML